MRVPDPEDEGQIEYECNITAAMDTDVLYLVKWVVGGEQLGPLLVLEETDTLLVTLRKDGLDDKLLVKGVWIT